MDLYIYYRAAVAHARQVQSQVQQMQASLRARYHVAGELKRRPRTSQAAEAADTWMEVYPNVPDDFENILLQAFDEANYAMLIDGERHVEYFQDFTTCA
ncbi:MAG: hypothetical protein JWP38_1818 [Herbaspirillum sp.]|jgi:hypothetical protein|nr:hypothetical protein [Herbaspirillum sp.]